jgi:hypothetical protein
MNLKSWIINITLAGGAGLLLIVLLYAGLGWYTNHGETMKLPNFKGMDTEKALKMIEDMGLRPIVVDSVYNGDLNKNTVAKQDPEPGTHVKDDRMIYLTLNSLEEPKTLMPQLVDKSYTLARALLKSRGLEMGTMSYRYDSIGHNLVLEQNFNGAPVQTGTKMKKGAKIDLVISTDRSSLLKKGDSLDLVMQMDSNGNPMDRDNKKDWERRRDATVLREGETKKPSTGIPNAIPIKK